MKIIQKHQLVYEKIVEMNQNDDTTNFNAFNFKSSITDNTNNVGIANIKSLVLLKYLSDFWRTLKISLTHYEVTLDLNCPENRVICEANRATTFAMNSRKSYLPVVTLLIEDNAKPLQQLRSEFKRTINWNKCQSKKPTEAQNRYIDFLISPSFHGVNR